MKLVGGAGPELLATLQRNLPEFSPSLIPRLAKGVSDLFVNESLLKLFLAPIPKMQG